MLDLIQNRLQSELQKRGLAVSKADMFDWLQDLLPEQADDTLNRMLHTVSSPFWGSMIQVAKMEPHLAEFEVWAAPKKLRRHVHPGVVVSAAVDIVEMVWQRNLLLQQNPFEVVGVRADWSQRRWPNPLFVRYQVSEAEIQSALTEARKTGQFPLECTVKICDRDAQVVADIIVICHILANHGELAEPPQKDR